METLYPIPPGGRTGMKQLATTMGLAMLICSPLMADDDNLVLFEDFEESSIIRHGLVERDEGAGVNGGTALKVTYEGFEQGSRRVVRRIPLGESGPEYSLVFDVKFDDDFQFVRGGKLHGFGPAQHITGGNAVVPSGWSARANFFAEGVLGTYLYNQDQPGQWGTVRRSEAPVFTPGQYHSVSLHVKINDPEEANGFGHIYVDGERVVQHDNVRFRGEDGDHTLISQFLFSTFHGGSSETWAPVDEEGNFTTVYAWFDNLAVYRGKHVRESPLGQESDE